MALNKLRFLADTKKCLVIDQTDYENLNIPVVFVNAKLLGTIGGPASAVVVKDSPSDPLVNLVIGTQSAEFSLPLANGEILNGNYTLDTSLNISRSNLIVRTLSSGGVNTISIIGIDLSGCFISGDTVTLSDSAQGNNGVKNVTAVAWDGDDTILTVSETLANESTNVVLSFDITRTSWFVGSYNYSGCNLVALTTNVTYDCTGTQLGSIYFYDTTILPAGQTMVSRLWNIEHPSNLVPAPIVNPITSEEQNVFVYQLATGPWGYRLDYTIQVDQTDALQVYYSPTTGSQNVTVSCVGDICAILDCYKKLVAQADQDIAANGASALSGTLLLVNSYLEIASNQKACGDEAGFCATIEVVKGLIEASGSCTCGCSDSPGNAWVNNAGFDSQTQIEAMALEIDQLQTDMVTVQEQSAIALENSTQAITTAEAAALQAGNAQISANQAQLAADTAQSTADSKVASVNGGIVDNTDPLNPLVYINLDPAQFTGNGALSNPITITEVDADLVNITPAIPGLTATDAQAAFSELQTSKLETVAVDGVTITGDGTVGNPLVAAGGGDSALIYSGLFIKDATTADPTFTEQKNTLGGTPAWFRSSAGYYICILTGAFPEGRTNIIHAVRFIGTSAPPYIVYSYTTGGPSGGTIAVKILVWDGTSWVLNDTLAQVFFHIEVYPA